MLRCTRDVNERYTLITSESTQATAVQLHPLPDLMSTERKQLSRCAQQASQCMWQMVIRVVSKLMGGQHCVDNDYDAPARVALLLIWL